MSTLPYLIPGDTVEIITPASRCVEKKLDLLQELIKSWGLQCILREDIYGPDLLCANSDALRLQHLQEALLRPNTKAVICARGGYGSMRLIPELIKMKKPSQPKLFVGMSDITALHLFFQKHWGWSSVHGSITYSTESNATLKSLLFDTKARMTFQGEALNAAALTQNKIQATVTGGNLCLVQTSVGTVWQMEARDKIIFLEEVSERGYRVDRMLEHLRQAGLFEGAKAIVFGDFTKCDEPDGPSLVPAVLKRFAESCTIPVIRISGIGHGDTNHPLLLGVNADLILGDEIRLESYRG